MKPADSARNRGKLPFDRPARTAASSARASGGFSLAKTPIWRRPGSLSADGAENEAGVVRTIAWRCGRARLQRIYPNMAWLQGFSVRRERNRSALCGCARGGVRMPGVGKGRADGAGFDHLTAGSLAERPFSESESRRLSAMALSSAGKGSIPAPAATWLYTPHPISLQFDTRKFFIRISRLHKLKFHLILIDLREKYVFRQKYVLMHLTKSWMNCRQE
jgi:hypothetical protein